MKHQFREKICEKRDALSVDQILQKSQKISTHVNELEEYKNSKTVLFYVSFQKEVDTQKMIKKFLESREKIVLIPYIKNKQIHISELRDFNDLETGTFDILEPKKEKIVPFDKEKIDIVLIPGLVFDRRGHRIGYGHGHYDQFLKTFEKDVMKIGLAYDFQVVDKIPEEEHDVPVDIVVTENEVIRVEE